MQPDLFTAGLSPGSRRARGRPRILPRRSCEGCGRTYPQKLPTQRYCGYACARRERLAPTVSRETATCVQCQQRFERARRSQSPRRFCSSVCRGKYANTLRPMRITCYRCHACGRIFEDPQHRGGRLYCSRACAGLDRNVRPFAYHSSRRYVALAREILERDHYRCGLCGKRINPRQRAPHPKSVSIDHIVPLSAGGTNARTNLQAAHLQCNSRRAHRGPAQLRLDAEPRKAECALSEVPASQLTAHALKQPVQRVKRKYAKSLAPQVSFWADGREADTDHPTLRMVKELRKR
jgi:HNH endonuclease